MLATEILTKFTGDTSGLESAIKKTTVLFDQFGNALKGVSPTGFEKVNSAAQGVNDTMRGMLPMIMSVAAGFGVAFGAEQVMFRMAGFVRQTVALGDSLEDLALQTRISIAALAGTRTVAEQVGTSIEALAMSTRYLVRSLAQSGDETSRQAEMLKKLGISQADLSIYMENSEAAINGFARGLATLGNYSERLQAAWVLAGRGGSQMVTLLMQLSETGMPRVSEETAESYRELGKFSDAMVEFWHNVQNFWVPAITTILHYLGLLPISLEEAEKRFATMQRWAQFGLGREQAPAYTRAKEELRAAQEKWFKENLQSTLSWMESGNVPLYTEKYGNIVESLKDQKLQLEGQVKAMESGTAAATRYVLTKRLEAQTTSLVSDKDKELIGQIAALQGSLESIGKVKAFESMLIQMESEKIALREGEAAALRYQLTMQTLADLKSKTLPAAMQKAIDKLVEWRREQEIAAIMAKHYADEVKRAEDLMRAREETIGKFTQGIESATRPQFIKDIESAIKPLDDAYDGLLHLEQQLREASSWTLDPVTGEIKEIGPLTEDMAEQMQRAFDSLNLDKLLAATRAIQDQVAKGIMPNIEELTRRTPGLGALEGIPPEKFMPQPSEYEDIGRGEAMKGAAQRTEEYKQTLSRLRQEQSLIILQNRLMGASYDGLAAQVSNAESILKAVIAEFGASSQQAIAAAGELQTLRDKLDVRDSIVALGDSITQSMNTMIQGIQQGTQDFGETIKNFAKNILLGIANALFEETVTKPIKNAIKNFAEGFAEGLYNGIEQAVIDKKDTFSYKLGKWLGEALRSAIDSITGIGGQGEGIGGKIVNKLVEAITGSEGKEGGGSTIGKIIDKIFGGAGEGKGVGGGSLTDKIAEKIVGAFGGGTQGNMIDKIAEQIMGGGGFPAVPGAQGMGGEGGGLGGLIRAFTGGQGMGGQGMGGMGGITDLFKGFDFSAIFEQISTMFTSMFSSLFEMISGLLSSLGGMMMDMFSGIGSGIMGLFGGLFEKGGPVPAARALTLMSFQSGGEIPILAHTGEYVINKRSSESIGRANLSYMNETGELPEKGRGVKQQVVVTINGDIIPRAPWMTKEDTIRVTTHDMMHFGPTYDAVKAVR